MKYEYMKESEQMLQYIQFPKFLLKLRISQTAKFLYMVLYDRARISRKNSWIDKYGGDFHFFNNQWILINRNLPDMMDVTEKKTVAIGEYVPLTEGRQILLDKGQGGRLVVVQLVNN